MLRARVQTLVEAARERGCDGSFLANSLSAASAEEIQAALLALEAAGEIVEWNHRWFGLRFTEWRVGTLEPLESGDALIRSGARSEPGFYSARRHLHGARAGDTVLIKPLKGKREARGRSLPAAAVVKVLDRRARTIVGRLERSAARWLLIPFDTKSPFEVEVQAHPALTEGAFAVVELESSGGRGVRLRGRLREMLGSIETPGTDVLVVLRHYGIQEEFPAQVRADAEGFPPDPAPSDWEGRQDLREQRIITIDGESARDFDDAISVERLPAGAFRLAVHIADVAHYVREGSALDLEAYRRGTSVYYPERAIPMLPEALSNGLCSLRPQVPRMTLSAFLDIGPDGAIRQRRFAETVIRSARRMTYEEVRRLLEEPAPGDRREYGDILTLLGEARELMQILNRARAARGSIDFDLPEGDVILDTDGTTVGIQPGERNVAHRIIEECMIAANEAVAFELESRQCPALYRVHDAPTRARLEELRDLLRPLGLDLRGDFENLHPSALQEVLTRAAGRPEEPFISAVVLRTVQRALYSPECRGHYALASRYYTHFTSPIRRYPDLVVHRRLKAILSGAPAEEAEASLLPERLPVIAEHCSTTERRAEQSERDLLQWKKVRFLERRIGEEFTGRITGVQPFGLFVQLDGYFVDGLVLVRTLADDFYVYEPEGHRLTGQTTGRVFQLASPVKIVLTGVDHRHRGLDLRIAGMPPPPARRVPGATRRAPGRSPASGRRKRG